MYQIPHKRARMGHPVVMTSAEFRERTLAFAVAVWRACQAALENPSTRFAADQLVRSASSVAANYRAANLGRSRPEFIAKLGIVREEADEALFWLEFMIRTASPGGPRSDLEALHREATEIAAIVSAAYNTSRRRYGKVENRK